MHSENVTSSPDPDYFEPSIYIIGIVDFVLYYFN